MLFDGWDGGMDAIRCHAPLCSSSWLMLTSDALTAMTIDLGQMTRKILNRSDGFLLFRVVCILIILQASLHHSCDSSLN